MHVAHLAVICREVTFEDDGLLTIRGVFSSIFGTERLEVLPAATLYVRFDLDIDDIVSTGKSVSDMKVNQYFSDGDSDTLIATIGPVTAPSRANPGTSCFEIYLEMKDILFDGYGIYHFGIVMNGDELARIPMPFMPV